MRRNDGIADNIQYRILIQVHEWNLQYDSKTIDYTHVT